MLLMNQNQQGSGDNFDYVRIKRIREDCNKLKDRFLKPKIKKLEETFTKQKI